MAEEIKWSYGNATVIEKDATPDPVWSYGGTALYYEYEAAAGGLSIPVAMSNYLRQMGA